MPLATEITRDGEVLQLRWSGYLLSCMMTAACKEAIPDQEITEEFKFGELPKVEYEGEKYDTHVDFMMVPIYYLDWNVPLLKKHKQVLNQEHNFMHHEEGAFTLLPGDTLRAWRQ